MNYFINSKKTYLLFFSWCGLDFQRNVRAAKCLHADAEFIHYTEVNALKRFSVMRPVDARLELAIGVAGKHHWKLLGGVLVAIGKGRTIKNKRVIQQRTSTFADGFESIEKIRYLSVMPFYNLEVLGALHVTRGPGGFAVIILRAAGDVAPVREGVPHASDAGKEIEVPVTLLMIEHEGGDPCGISPISKDQHVKH